MIKKEDGKIDWTKSAVEIERQIRAMSPWPSAFTKVNGKNLKIWDAKVIAMFGGDLFSKIPGQNTFADISSASGETAKSRSSARQVRQCRKSMTCTAWPCMYARRRKRCWQSCGKNWSGISRLTKVSVPFIYSLTSAESISFFILFTHRLFIIEEQKKGKELWQSEKSES